MSSAAEHTGLAAFREAQLPRVRAYVDVVCPPERSEEAVSAAFVDFLARAGAVAGGPGEPDSDHALLRATRSAAAGRFLVTAPQAERERSLKPECRAMPELLALHANRERPGDQALIVSHLAGCAICAHTLARMQEAERGFAHGSGELPELEIEPTTVDTSGFAVAPAMAESDPEPQPETHTLTPPPEAEIPPRPVGSYPRRSGGLVGAIRKFGRPPHG